MKKNKKKESQKKFFNATPLYKEYMILDLISKNKNITQRELSLHLNVAVSMINSYLDEYEEKGFMKRNKISPKNIDYVITKLGIERKKILNIGYLNNSLKIFDSARGNVVEFLLNVQKKGLNKIILYGAGEVAEILLQAILIDKNIMIDVVAVIDDNLNKQRKKLLNTPIISLGEHVRYEHDGILISSYTNSKIINKKLENIKYPKKRIINFFD